MGSTRKGAARVIVDAYDRARSKMVWGECPDIDRVTMTDHANRQSRTRTSNCEQTKHQRTLSLQLDDGAVFAKDHDE